MYIITARNLVKCGKLPTRPFYNAPVGLSEIYASFGLNQSGSVFQSQAVIERIG